MRDRPDRAEHERHGDDAVVILNVKLIPVGTQHIREQHEGAHHCDTWSTKELKAIGNIICTRYQGRPSEVKYDATSRGRVNTAERKPEVHRMEFARHSVLAHRSTIA